MKKIAKNLSLEWKISHSILIGINSVFAILGLIMAVLVNFISKCQRANVDNNLNQIFGDDELTQPIIILLVWMSTILIFAVIRAKVFNSIDITTSTKMLQEAEHGIIFPLLFEFTFFFQDDIIKSCSAEIIISILVIMLIFDFIHIAWIIYRAAINNASYVKNWTEKRNHRQQEILDMLKQIENNQH